VAFVLARRLRIATRGSPLARWQANHVASLLSQAGYSVDVIVVETAGDLRRDVPISELGGQGVFVKEVQTAVLDGRADVAVHSAKDLPSTTADGLVLAAVPPREDPRDALVGAALDALGTGATVGTGSVRRRAQLAWLRPDLTFVGLRGNMDTRVGAPARPDGPAAVVVAVAALIRLGWQDRVAEILSVDAMLPQVAQGALGIECRQEDDEVRAQLAAIEDGPSRLAVDAERGFLAQLGGGCDLPVGALGRAHADGALSLTGLLCSLDGRVRLRVRLEGTASDPVGLGVHVAQHLLDRAGGQALLDDVAALP
jgi:hydroxymethylbilane synthase